MKKIVSLLLIAALALSMSLCITSCDSSDNGKESQFESASESISTSESISETASTTESVSESTAPSTVTYTITIVNEVGAPVAGVEAQICVGDICKKPQVTNEDGVVTFKIDAPGDDEIKLQINRGPEGYEYLGENGKIAMDAEQTELTITLKSVA